MEDTQYTPWLELGIDELAYYKKRFLETCAELAAWEKEAMAAREYIDTLELMCLVVCMKDGE